MRRCIRPPSPPCLIASALLALSACVAETSPMDATVDELGADAGLEVELADQALASGTLRLNDVYYVPKTKADAPMYTTASGDTVIRRIPQWATVKVVIAEPSASGRYRVDHAGTLGFMHGSDLALHQHYQGTLSQERIDALARARRAMGFSYWWGNAAWLPSGPTTWPIDNRGDCDGVCGEGKKCTHEATGGGEEYGSDCSGLVSTIWGLDDFDPETNPERNGYGTVAFNRDGKKWKTVPLSEARPGDAAVRYDEGRKHIVLLAERRGASDTFRVYECAGCTLGCRPWWYSLAADGPWHAIRRTGW